MNSKKVKEKYSKNYYDTICCIDVETVEVKGKEKVYSIGVILGGKKLYKEILNTDIDNIYNNYNKYIKDYFSNLSISTNIPYSMRIFNFFYDNNQELNRRDVYISVLNWLYSKSNGKHLYIYALNGGKFDHYLLIDEISRYTNNVLFEKCMINNKIYNITINYNIYEDINKTKKFHLRDLLSITGPSSLNKLCKNLGVKKDLSKNIEFDIKKFRQKFNKKLLSVKDRRDIDKYLMGDIVSLFIITKKIGLTFYSELDIDINKELTVGNIAYKIFKSFLKTDIYFQRERSVVGLQREALYGGRTYCIRTYGKNIIEIDVNSLYPYSMKENYYPTGRYTFIGISNEIYDPFIGEKCNKIETMNEFQKRIKREIRVLNNNKNLYILSCCLEISGEKFEKLKISPIPIATISDEERILIERNRNIIFNKNYTYKPQRIINNAAFTNIDLKYLLSIGYRITHYNYCFYWDKKEKIFEKYIDVMYKKRLEAKKNNNEVLDMIYKLLMNSLYGKMCQRPISEETSIVRNDLLKEHEKNVEIRSILSTDFIKRGNYSICRSIRIGNVTKPTYLGCFILSYARQLMNKAIDTVGGFNNPRFYYSDTDSLFIDEDDFELIKKSGLLCDKTIGKFKLEGKYAEVVFAGSKMKALKYIDSDGKEQVKVTCKGFDTDKVSFEDVYNLVFNNKKVSYINTQFTKSLYDGMKISDVEKEFRQIGPKDTKLSDDKEYWIYN